MTGDQHLRELGSDTLTSAIGTTRSPLIITDNRLPDNPIVYTNQAFLDLCGYNEDEIIGRNCRFLQGDDSDKKVIKQIGKAVADNKSIRVTLKNYRKNGEEFWNDLLISPIKNNKGEVTHFIGMQLDITERIQYAHKLEATEKDLRMSNQELEQFTYAASHDLQEPLRMVSSYLQLIKKRYGDKLDENASTFINFANEGAERMQSLVNDLLTLSRVSSIDRTYKKTAMNEVVNRAIFNLQLTISETKADIIVKDLPSVKADAVQLVQLMQNLIGNAIKYRSPARTPKVTISADETDSDYIFSVADNGIGINEQYHSRIFIIFQRLHTREEYPGTGVGLAICSKIIERHGGKLWVKSTEGKGSTFKFSIPKERKKTA